MKRAFTLAELLVVIAIVAILAALIFPVFTKVKASANESASVSNLAQLGKAYLLYTADNSDHTPYVGDLRMITDLRAGRISYLSFPNYVGQKEIKETLMPYVKEERIWKSPIDPGDEKFPGGSAYLEIGSSYDTISSFCAGSISSFKSPSEAGLLREGSPYKNKRAATWRADGSVKTLPWQISARQMDSAYFDLGCNN
jgi:prepilin-type N-terminal cleavage/methylation domain-containing protein